MARNANIALHLLLLFGLIPSNITKSIISNRKYCGFQHSDDYERYSSKISIDEFPWMAQLLYNNQTESKCSGSLINNRYILSAAHCVVTRSDFILTGVRLGDHNVTTSQDCIKNHEGEIECSDGAIEIGIEEVTAHPSHNLRSSLNDISLIRLADPITFSDFVRPICLPDKDSLILDNIEDLYTSGWGTFGFNTNPTEIKKRIPTSLVPIEECKKNYEPRKIVSENQICGRESDIISCIGDSGAPLMYSVKNQWEQVGIMSFGQTCGRQSITIYTKVFNYLDWIKSTVRP